MPALATCPKQLRRALAGAAAVLLAGCQTPYPLPPVDVVAPSAAMPLPAVAPPAAPPNGAIFRADVYRPLFENHRARLVGDTLTVQIAEKVSAVQRSSSQIDRSGAVSGGLTAVPLLNPAALARASATGNGSNTFEGKGSTENSNDFSGSVTVTVVQVLPNGHLLVAGEKQIGVNANVDVLRFSGQVDPRAITPGNTVASAQVANVRIEQRGRGQQADAQAMGWLSRFFLNILPI
jgi:flagellar L-ring protein FlgH